MDYGPDFCIQNCKTHHLAWDHPVGEVTVFGDLHGSEDGEMDVTSPDHGEAVVTREIGGAGYGCDCLLSSIDEVGINLFFGRERSEAKDSILRLEVDCHTVRDK